MIAMFQWQSRSHHSLMTNIKLLGPHIFYWKNLIITDTKYQARINLQQSNLENMTWAPYLVMTNIMVMPLLDISLFGFQIEPLVLSERKSGLLLAYPYPPSADPVSWCPNDKAVKIYYDLVSRHAVDPVDFPYQ